MWPCHLLILGPLSFVAVVAVAVMVCGRHGIESQAVNSTNNNHAALLAIFSLYS